MFLSVLALIFLANCGDDNGGDKPIAAPSLIGSWKMEKIMFETETQKSEVALPSTYAVNISILEDGNYTYQDNGTEKKQTWKYDDVTKRLTVKNDDGSESSFDVTLSDDGASWSYKAMQIDLAKELSGDERATVDFLTLVSIMQEKPLSGNTLKVFFVMKKNS